MTFDLVLRSFLANEGKRFRRRRWSVGVAATPEARIYRSPVPYGDYDWIIAVHPPHNILDGSPFIGTGPDYAADDWEEVRE